MTMSTIIARLILVTSLLVIATAFTNTRVSQGFLPCAVSSRVSHIFAAAPSEEEEPAVLGITLKLALDRQWGVAERAATASVRFTSPQSLDMVHRLRRDSDAVLIGRATVEDDNPSLTVRRIPLKNDAQQPVRVILDTNLSLNSQEYTIFNDGLPTIVYHVDSLDDKKVNEYATEQTKCVGIKLDSDGALDLAAIVKNMKTEQRLNHVMVEGGPAVARAFLQNKLVDRAILVQALQVEFEDPYPSGMTTATLSENGLDYLGDVDSGDGDVFRCWSRSKLSWPREKLQDWP